MNIGLNVFEDGEGWWWYDTNAMEHQAFSDTPVCPVYGPFNSKPQAIKDRDMCSSFL